MIMVSTWGLTTYMHSPVACETNSSKASLGRMRKADLTKSGQLLDAKQDSSDPTSRQSIHLMVNFGIW